MVRVLAVALLLAGCHDLFQLDHVGLPDASVPIDAAPSDLECAMPLPAIAIKPSSSYVEPGLTTSGLHMVMRRGGGGGNQEIARASLDVRFDPPGAVTQLPAHVDDPTFAMIDGTPYAFGAVGPMPRHLEVCPSPSASSTCEPIILIDADGDTVVGDDVDGPSVAHRDGQLVMLISRRNAFYLAVPVASNLLTWRASRLSLGELDIDDGALTRDGRFLFASTADALLVYRWDGDEQSYLPLSAWPGFGQSPDIGPDDGTTFLLAVTRTDRGVTEPYLSDCVRRYDTARR